MDVSARPTPTGWYPDPAGSDRQRWWSGVAWTDHVRDVPLATPVTPPAATGHSVPSAPAQWSASDAAASRASVGYGSVSRGPLPGASDFPTRGGGSFSATPTFFELPTRWHTVSVWLLAVSPIVFAVLLIGIGPFVLAGLFDINASAFGYLVPAVLGLVLPLLLCTAWVMRDRRQLQEFGFRRLPSPFWILLGPLAYLIARTVHVMGTVRRGGGPLWTYLAIVVGSTVLTFALRVLVLALLTSGHSALISR
ncbi:DUF2510 domain-containing protein [Galbitalea soli]|uniref:DUF2510 domain-containing protein n=1 Tax=Galbitalea soli TaxID=1268042 RepID=A0A7C9TPQ7_9MICO|nr:DUF2510 domain-containing protein [Galbitalea soli]NEM90104.1 DUF2510 domain-containing protein [Galbitalea soli]NYJ30811.1 flagellar biosynthesis protein FliQ [Galbitalea soli]